MKMRWKVKSIKRTHLRCQIQEKIRDCTKNRTSSCAKFAVLDAEAKQLLTATKEMLSGKSAKRFSKC